jgi:hypothetical protein
VARRSLDGQLPPKTIIEFKAGIEPSSRGVTMPYASKSPSENSDRATGLDKSGRKSPVLGSYRASPGTKSEFARKLTSWVSPSVVGIGFIVTLVWMGILGWLVVRSVQSLF